MSIDFKEVGRRISKCRRKAGLKQYQICEMIDVNYKYISNLETGRSAPSLGLIIKLCDVLHTTPDYLLLGIENQSAELSSDEINNQINNLNTENRKIILELIKILNENQGRD